MPPQQPAIGADVTALMPPVGADVSALMAPTPESQQQPAAQPHPNQGLYDTMQGVGKWAARAIGGAFMGPAGVEAADHPGLTLASAAAGPVLKHGPELIRRGLGVSGQRAGQRLSDVALKAKDATVSPAKLGDPTLRAIELGERGARLPKSVKSLGNRITDPAKGDMTFGEARDVYSNISRLSANERNQLNPVMAKQVAAIRQALHEALTDSAETVGMGSQYAKGIREYARAAKAADATRTAAKYGAGIAGAGVAGNWALDKLLDALGRTAPTR